MSCAVALLVLNTAIFGQNAAAPNAKGDKDLQSGYCPYTHELEAEPAEEHWFEGSIGNSSVRMYLNRGGSGVVGLFYATNRDWTPTYLGGEWKAGTITLSAESADHAPKGHLKGEIVNGALIGKWIPDSSDQANSVRLAAMQRPACDGRGAWKRFDDPKWPVSFSYPASWRIKEDGQALQLICPDPESMAYENDVTVYEGKRSEGKPVGPFDLLHCAKGWRFGRGCDTAEGNSSLRSVEKVSHLPGKTILNLEHEWRVYCSDGGYEAQGDGEDQVVLLQDYWIEFVGEVQADRLVKSGRVRTATDPK